MGFIAPVPFLWLLAFCGSGVYRLLRLWFRVFDVIAFVVRIVSGLLFMCWLALRFVRFCAL